MTPSTSPGFTKREVILALGIGLGVLGVLGYSALQKKRQHSQDQVVICVIRQLSAAADQYYIENGVSTASLDQLVGATNYLKAIAPIDGEKYPPVYVQGVTITVGGIGGARTVTYVP